MAVVKRYWLLVVGCGIITAALLITGWAKLNRRVEAPWKPLANRLPLIIDGWQGEDVPLGPTEATIEAVGKLNYNDYIYRVYRKSGQEVFVYAMFWQQGRISVREMAGHTPDGCWIANGARFAARPDSARALQITGRKTAPAEVRTFVFSGGQRVDAVWWHIWGDNVIDPGFAVKSLMPTLRETWIWLVKRRGQPRDQLLVRIHTAGELTTVLDSAPVTRFLELFPKVFRAEPL